MLPQYVDLTRSILVKTMEFYTCQRLSRAKSTLCVYINIYMTTGFGGWGREVIIASRPIWNDLIRGDGDRAAVTGFRAFIRHICCSLYKRLPCPSSRCSFYIHPFRTLSNNGSIKSLSGWRAAHANDGTAAVHDYNGRFLYFSFSTFKRVCISYDSFS